MQHLSEALRLPVVSNVLRTDPLVFVDVGAAVGVEEPWLSLVRSTPDLTRVVAFEPNPDNFANIAKLPNGKYYQMAIADQRGTLPFYLHSTLSSLVDRSAEVGESLATEQVTVERLEDLRRGGTILSLDVIKTDAELMDFEVIVSAGEYLRSEVLAVQCEFSVHGGDERPFRDYDALLQPLGFKLFGLSYYRGSEGEIGGGNFLYLRSVFGGGAALTRTQGVKLFVIALALSKLDTAYIVARYLGDNGVLKTDESQELLAHLGRWIYVPDTQSFAASRIRVATALGNLTAIAAGGNARAVSAPQANRLENYRKLVRRPSRLFPAEKALALYERAYKDASKH